MSFSIDVRFLGGLTNSQRTVFEIAAARWSEIIIGDLPRVRVGNEIIDDVAIAAQGVFIDGSGDPVTGRNILGRAAPTCFRSGTLLPACGFMEFDTADLARLEMEGSLQNVIIHEMGHVLGIGSNWRRLGLLQGAGTSNPVFLGAAAMQEYAALINATQPTPVPAANTNGPGTRDSHWREGIFGHELMTGSLNDGINPISRLTIASLQDLGYEVDFGAAEPYVLPSAFELVSMGIGAAEEVCRRCSQCSGVGRLPKPIVLPQDALVD